MRDIETEIQDYCGEFRHELDDLSLEQWRDLCERWEAIREEGDPEEEAHALNLLLEEAFDLAEQRRNERG